MCKIRGKNIEIISVLSESIYVRWLKNNLVWIMAYMIASTFFCILSYPGILYTDSYQRENITSSIKLSIHAFLDGNADLTTLQSWLTVTPSFFMLLSKEAVGSIVLYTFIQCVIFFLSVHVFSCSVTQHNHKIWNIACIFFTPVVWNFGVYYEPSVGCVTAILFIILLIWKWDTIENKFDKIITFGLLMFLSYICFGYRANAFTIIPILILLVILRTKMKKSKVIVTLAVIMGFVMTSIIPKILNIDTMSSWSGSYIWEIVSTIQTMDAEGKAEYIDYLDDIFGEGVTAEALNNNSYTEYDSSINPIWWGRPFDIGEVSKPENTKRILSKYIELIEKEPEVYLKVKWDFISHTLGISQPLRMAEYHYNNSDNMGEYGFNDSGPRKKFVKYFLSYIEYMKIFRMPWVMFLAGLILILVWRFMYCGAKSAINLYEAIYGVALFYYGGFLLNNQSFEFRYFFPSWLLLFILIVSLIGDICFNWKIVKKITMILFPIVVFVCLFGAYRVYTSEGDSTVQIVKEGGNKIFQDNERQIYYYCNKIYFIVKTGGDIEYPYFLHYYTPEGDMINDDFNFKDKSIDTSFWKENIAVVDMPEQEISMLEFGQYYCSTIFWINSMETSDFINMP